MYALHHVPTGLEYVGASKQVSRRLGQHRTAKNVICGAWKQKLRACMLIARYGPFSLETDDGEVDLVDFEQVGSLEWPIIASVLDSADRLGLDASFDHEDIVPILLEPVPVENLPAAELHHLSLRRPVLNRGMTSGYPQGILQPALVLGPPPRCLSVSEARAVWVLAQKEKIECRQLWAGYMPQMRLGLGLAIRDKVCRVALEEAEKVFSLESSHYKDVLRSCGMSGESFAFAYVEGVLRSHTGVAFKCFA